MTEAGKGSSQPNQEDNNPELVKQELEGLSLNIPPDKLKDLQELLTHAPAEQHAVIISQYTASFHSGPLPSPEKLEKYRQIGDHVLTHILESEKDVRRHAQNMERSELRGKLSVQWGNIGLVAFALVLFVGSALFAAYMGWEALSLFLGGTTLTTVLVALINGWINRKPEEEK